MTDILQSERQRHAGSAVTHPGGKVEPDGAPGQLVIEVGAGVVLGLVHQALQLALHVRAAVLCAEVQHLLCVFYELLSILRLCTEGKSGSDHWSPVQVPTPAACFGV